MKTFKSLVLSVVTAATTLGFVAISAPAQACVGCGGIKLNGPALNGPVIQGPVIQGPVIQGPVIQGPVIQGPILQGPVLQGAALNGMAARDAQLQAASTGPVRIGQPVAVTLAGGRMVRVK